MTKRARRAGLARIATGIRSEAVTPPWHFAWALDKRRALWRPVKGLRVSAVKAEPSCPRPRSTVTTHREIQRPPVCILELLDRGPRRSRAAEVTELLLDSLSRPLSRPAESLCSDEGVPGRW